MPHESTPTESSPARPRDPVVDAPRRLSEAELRWRTAGGVGSLRESLSRKLELHPIGVERG